MRAYLPEYELKTPATLAEALRLLSDEPGVWRPFAGGTDLMVLLEAGKLTHTRFVSLWGLPELTGIESHDDQIIIGALTTYSQMQAHAALRAEFPLLCEAASWTGAVAIQNRGTLGGNIANASPAADSLPALLVYDAELELISANGSRVVPYNGFHTGYKTSVLRPDEVIKTIRLPRTTAGWRQHSRKVGTRKALLVPTGYVTNRFGIDYVTVLVKDGSASSIPVQTAPSAEPGKVELLSGASAGDTLIGVVGK